MASETHYDVVIVGSGFAGYELARAAVAAGRSVAVIERGTAGLTPSNQQLSAVPYSREPIASGGFDFGASVPSGFDGLPRYIGLGGTSQLWSGKWRRLDSIDLQRQRDQRRWPIADDDLERCYDRVAIDFGWPVWPDDRGIARHRATLDRAGIRAVDMFEQVPPRRLRHAWQDLVATGVNLTCNSTIRAVSFDASGRVLRGLEVEAAGGTRVLAGTTVVIACGGIESVHVSHFIRRGSTAISAVPTRYGGYMDHPKAFIGTLDLSRNRTLVEDLQSARDKWGRLFAFALPESEIAASGLGNHTVFLWAPELPGGAWRLAINLEQFPEAHNVIAVDPPCVSWRVSHDTRNNYRRFMETLQPRLEAVFGTVSLLESPDFRGASHPAGSLPMGMSGAATLDPHGRFWDVDNLFCVSAAAFPIAGSANPTMTVAALAQRLAAHLVSRNNR